MDDELCPKQAGRLGRTLVFVAVLGVVEQRMGDPHRRPQMPLHLVSVFSVILLLKRADALARVA